MFDCLKICFRCRVKFCSHSMNREHNAREGEIFQDRQWSGSR